MKLLPFLGQRPIYWYLRLMKALMTTAETWGAWDEGETLLHHQYILGFLWMCLQASGACWRARSSSTAHQCDAASSEVEELQMLDIADLGSYFFLTLQQDKNREHLMSRAGNDAQILIDLLQGVRGLGFMVYPPNNIIQLLDHCNSDSHLTISMHRALIKLSKKSGLQPKCLVLSGVKLQGGQTLHGGGYGDVWKEHIEGYAVGVKVIRCFERSDVEKITKVLC